MAFGILHKFPGATQEQYEVSMKAAHGGDGALPEGQIFHAAGAIPGGWMVFAIHDSKESWEKFRDGTLLPSLQKGIEGGFTTPPEETEIDVFLMMP